MILLIKDSRFIWALAYLIFLGLVGLFADEITSNDGFIPFGPDEVHSATKIYSPPGSFEQAGSLKKIHYLGTDQIGRDVASRIIHGIPVAFKVGIWSSLIALFIALILGALSGFYGNRSHRINAMQILLLLIGLFVIHFYSNESAFMIDSRGTYSFRPIWYMTLFSIGLVGLIWLNKWAKHLNMRSFWLPWDILVVKLIEVFKSIPRLFLLLAVFAIITRPSLLWVILIIGLIRWPNLTRIIRAEIINLRQESFIKNVRLLGLSDLRIFTHHILPNIYKPILVMTAFNMGSAILIESSLSFLQIGLPIEEVSWGRMLGDARFYIRAWWMAIGPGFLIFSMILCFNIIGDRISYHFDSLSFENHSS